MTGSSEYPLETTALTPGSIWRSNSIVSLAFVMRHLGVLEWLGQYNLFPRLLRAQNLNKLSQGKGAELMIAAARQEAPMASLVHEKSPPPRMPHMATFPSHPISFAPKRHHPVSNNPAPTQAQKHYDLLTVSRASRYRICNI
jgi:hypothetical protein